jgi:hypothetical protein
MLQPLRLLRLIWLGLWAVGAMAAAAQAAPAVEEADLKAAYIFNFIQFIDWPGGESAAGQDMTVCVSPFSPLKRPLTALEGRQTTKGGAVRVKLLEMTDVRPCRVIVLYSSDVMQVLRLVRTLPPGHGILTISDELTFVDPEIVIALSQQEGRIVFGISSEAAARAGLAVSSRLLRLAKVTR